MKRNRSAQILLLVFAAIVVILAVPRRTYALGYKKNTANGTIKVNHLYTSEIKDDASLYLAQNIIIEVDAAKTIKSIVTAKKNLTVTIRGTGSSRKMFKVYHRGSGSYNGIDLGDDGSLTLQDTYLYVDATKRGIITGEFSITNSAVYSFAKDKNAVYTHSFEMNNTDTSLVHFISSGSDGLHVVNNMMIKAGRMISDGKLDGIYCEKGSITVKEKGDLTAKGKRGIHLKKSSLSAYGRVEAEGRSSSGIVTEGSMYGYVKSESKGYIKATGKIGHGISASTWIYASKGGQIAATGSKNGLYAGSSVSIYEGGIVNAKGDSDGIYAKDTIYFTKGYINASGNGAVYARKKIVLGKGMEITVPTKGRIVYRTIGDGVWIASTYAGPSVKKANIMYTAVDGSVSIVSGTRATDTFKAKYTGNAYNLIYTFKVSKDQKNWTTVQSGSSDSYPSVAADSGKYLQVIVTSKSFSGSVRSGIRSIYTAYPVVKKQASPASTKVGSPFTFSIVADNVAIYQWRVATAKTGVTFYSTAEVKKHANMGDNNKSSITITPTDTWLNGKYIMCILKSKQGLTIYPTRVLMTVSAAPTPTPAAPTPTPAAPTPTPAAPTPTPAAPTPTPAAPIPTPVPAPAEKGVVLTDSKGITYTSTTTDASKPRAAYTKPAPGTAGSIAIPATVTIGGVKYVVNAISSGAFKGNTDITKVVIGKNVTMVGAGAFSGCTGMQELVIGSAVTSINEKAFYNCSGISSVVIPGKVKSIGKSAFENCSSLKNITIKTDLLNSDNVGSKAVNNTHDNAVFKVPSAKLEDYKKLMKGRGASSKATYKGI